MRGEMSGGAHLECPLWPGLDAGAGGGAGPAPGVSVWPELARHVPAAPAPHLHQHLDPGLKNLQWNHYRN